MTSTRAGRIAAFLIGLLPTRVRETYFANPERALVNVACILIGVQALLRPPLGDHERTPITDWPPFLHYEWAVAMLVGGVFAIYGQWSHIRPVVRFSGATLALECWLYAVQVVTDLGARGAISATIFFALGVANAARVLLSLATTERLGAFYRRQQRQRAATEDATSPGDG